MAEQILFPQWRSQNQTTRYPFAQHATLTNEAGLEIAEGCFVDAALYPVGGQSGLFLSSVVISFQAITFYVGDVGDRARASGTAQLLSGEDNINLVDAYNRPAGVLVSDVSRRGFFQTWGVGTHVFEPEETEFAATVCFPTPQIGVRGVALETGEVLTGDVWLVGADGVVLRTEEAHLPATCANPDVNTNVIRVDVVGDPLFRRRLCTPNDLFHTPRFIKTVRVIGPDGSVFECAPDEFGNLQVVAGDAFAADTILRLVVRDNGLNIHTVGSVDPALKRVF